MEMLKGILCKELEGFGRSGEISRSELEDIHILTDSIKNLGKIIMMEDQAYSYDGGGQSYNSSRGGSYRASGRGGSYGNVSYNSSNRGYSSETSTRGRYSRGNDNSMAIEKLEDMLHGGEVEGEEEEILRRAIDMLKK